MPRSATYQPPIPTKLTKARVYTFAERVAGRLDFEPGDSIKSLVAQLGGKLEYRLRSEVAGRLPESIVVEALDDFTIYVPSTTSSVRDQFTIAHELGHLFLHYPLVAKCFPGQGMKATRHVDDADTDLQRAEWEANWFAAGFLMPQELFKDKLELYNRNLTRVASFFGVSERAAEIRAQTVS